jgi:hypothetical protein
MANKFSPPAADEGAHERDHAEIERSQERDLWLRHFRQAMEDTGWTIDALAAHWDIHRSHVQRLHDGDKPWSVDRLLSLPDDLEARLEALRAEYFGLIVVEPLRGIAAQKAVVAGLIGLMAPALPARAGKPLRAALEAKKNTDVA